MSGIIQDYFFGSPFHTPQDELRIALRLCQANRSLTAVALRAILKYIECDPQPSIDEVERLITKLVDALDNETSRDR